MAWSVLAEDVGLHLPPHDGWFCWDRWFSFITPMDLGRKFELPLVAVQWVMPLVVACVLPLHGITTSSGCILVLSHPDSSWRTVITTSSGCILVLSHPVVLKLKLVVIGDNTIEFCVVQVSFVVLLPLKQSPTNDCFHSASYNNIILAGDFFVVLVSDLLTVHALSMCVVNNMPSLWNSGRVFSSIIL